MSAASPKGLFGISTGSDTWDDIIGFIPKKGIDAYKEISGAKAAEDANEQARVQYEEGKVEATKQRADSVEQGRRNQITNSNNATSARGATSSATTKRGSSTTGDVKDFLGV